MNEPMGRLGSLSPARERRIALATRSSACVLADDALPQAIFHGDQLLHFAFQHLRDGDSGPLGDDAGDVFLVDFFFQHALRALCSSIASRQLCKFFFGLADQAVANFGDALQIAFALFGLLFDLQLFDLLFQLASVGDQVFFLLPVGFERVGFLANFGEFFFDDCQALSRVGVVFFLQRLLFDFKLRGAALELIDFGGQRIDLNAQWTRPLRRSDRWLCRAESGRRCSDAKACGGDDRGIFDAHAMMHFVALFQAAQNRDRVFDIGFADENDLEAALEGGVFFDVLAVFVQRGGADGAQLSASQRGLEHVGSVDRAFGWLRRRPGCAVRR